MFKFVRNCLILGLISSISWGAATIFSGSDIKTLKQNIDLFGVAKIMSGSLDPSVTAVSAPKGSTYQSTSTALLYLKQDAGLSTNWTAIATALGYTPENVANKSTDVTLGGGTPSNTLYPSQAAAKSYIDTGLSAKQNTLTFGSVSTTTTGLTIGSGSNATVGPNVTVDIQNATDVQPGLLTAADHTTYSGYASTIASKWSTTGNSGTDGGTTNFVGTTDNVNLVLKRNSVTMATLGSADTTFAYPVNASGNGAASYPALKLSGTVFSGGTATTTKPYFLLEPAGTTSTAWSTSGSMLGINAPTGFSGNLLDIQVNGSNKFYIGAGGDVVAPGGVNVGSNGTQTTANNTPLYLQKTITYGGTSSRNAIETSKGSNTMSAGMYGAFAVLPLYNQSGTAGATDFLINRTENSLGSGSQLFADYQVGGISKYSVDHLGAVTEYLPSTFIKVGNSSNQSASVAMSGDGALSSTGVLTIANNAITNIKLNTMAASTIKANSTVSTAAPQDITAPQLTAMLSTFTGDSGSGGVNGLVPAPASGDAASGKYLKADGTWATVVATASVGHTGSSTLYIEYVRSTSICTSGTCSVDSKSDGIDSVTFVSTGRYAVNFHTGTWSVAPSCVVNGYVRDSNNNLCSFGVLTPTTTTAAGFYCVNNAGTVTNSSYDVICTGFH